MADAIADTSQVPLRELPQLSASLRDAIGRMPAPEKTRAALETALSAECVQCAIKLTGADLLALPDSEDPRLDRIRQGYCARNGCDCHFYKVSRGAHPDLDWTRLLSETNVSVEASSAAAAAQAAHRLKQEKTKKALRIAAALAGLALVYIARQYYYDGSIPFLREPEKFEVDKQTEPEQFQVDRAPEPQKFEVDRGPQPERFKVDRNP